jgi:two-component system, chemotaxis family, protein-glutamate methylesterase/glutaminase
VADMMALNGPPSPITCPACGGALWETREDGVTRYACHVGHQYAPDSLLAEHGESVEQALWSAVRVLEQHAELRLRMSTRARNAGLTTVAEGFAEDSHNYHLQAQDIRQLLLGHRDRVMPDPSAVRSRAQAR